MSKSKADLGTLRRPLKDVLSAALACNRKYNEKTAKKALEECIGRCQIVGYEVVLEDGPPRGHGLIPIAAVDEVLVDAGLGMTEAGDVIGWIAGNWYNLSLAESLEFGRILVQLAQKTDSCIGSFCTGYDRWLSNLMKAFPLSKGKAGK